MCNGMVCRESGVDVSKSWKDVTSYSQHEERVPRTLEARVGDVRLVVTRNHWDKDRWYGVIIVGSGTLRDSVLNSSSLELAKKELLDAFSKWLRLTLGALEKGLNVEALPCIRSHTGDQTPRA